MANDQQDTLLPLGRATVVLQLGGKRRRFRVDTAMLTARGRRAVRLQFTGHQGSVMLELSRTAFWRMTSEFHERSILADAPIINPRTPRKRS